MRYTANTAPERPIPPSGPALLLACARLELDEPARARLEAALSAGIDWPATLSLAQEHGLVPLLHHHLSTLAPGRVPKPILVELWGRYEQVLRRNRAMARELLRILAALDSHRIPALPYKGPALGHAIYADLGLREFGDLDILLRREDVLAAKRVLEDLGYADEYSLDADGDRALLASAAHYHFVLRAPAALVELHWKTDPDFPVEHDDASWWGALPRAPFEGSFVRAFSAADLFLVLCLHGTKHRWASLAWVVDVGELLRRRQALDWQAISRRSDAMRVRRRCLLGVRLAHDLLDAPIPAALADALSNPGVDKAARAICAEMFEESPPARGPMRLLTRELSLYDRPSQRWRHVLHVIVSPGIIEWSRWPLPRALGFVYIPLRLARLAAKHLIPRRRIPPAATPRTPPPRPRSTG